MEDTHDPHAIKKMFIRELCMNKIIFSLLCVLIASSSIKASRNNSTTPQALKSMALGAGMFGVGAYTIKCIVGLHRKVNQLSSIPLEQISMEQLSYANVQYVSFDAMKKDLNGLYGLGPHALGTCITGAYCFGWGIITLSESSSPKENSKSIKNL